MLAHPSFFKQSRDPPNTWSFFPRHVVPIPTLSSFSSKFLCECPIYHLSSALLAQRLHWSEAHQFELELASALTCPLELERAPTLVSPLEPEQVRVRTTVSFSPHIGVTIFWSWLPSKHDHHLRLFYPRTPSQNNIALHCILASHTAQVH